MEHNKILSFDELPTEVSQLSTKIDMLVKLIQEQKGIFTDEPDKLLNIEEAAIFLNLSKPTLYSKVSRGELPVYKPAGTKRLYFTKDVLMSYVKKGRVNTNAEIEEESVQYIIRRKGANHEK